MRIENGLLPRLPGRTDWLARYVRALVVGQVRAWWHVLWAIFTGRGHRHTVWDYFRGSGVIFCLRWGTHCTCGETFFDAEEI